MEIKQCQNCGIVCGGTYILGRVDNEEDLLLSDKPVPHIEQRLYKVGSFKLCSWCLDTLEERGWLAKAWWGDHVIMIFQDGSDYVLSLHWFYKTDKGVMSWQQLKQAVEWRVAQEALRKLEAS